MAKNPLKKLVDEAKSDSKHAHDRMTRELSIFNNERPYMRDEKIAKQTPAVAESLNPQIQKGILRLIPAFLQQAVRIDVEPDRSKHTAEEYESIQDLREWTTMYEEVDHEGQRLQTGIYHNLVFGIAISKVYYDPRYKVIRSLTVNPMSIAVPKHCTEVNFSNAEYIVHSNTHNPHYLKRRYGINTKDDLMIDELWMRREFAEDHGVQVGDTKSQIIRAALQDDKTLECKPSPFWYPDIPFVGWRNFPILCLDGRAQDFWGHGYGSLAWPEQKFLDQVYASLIQIMQNMPVGAILSKKGAIDMDSIQETIFGSNIEVDFDKSSIQDLRQVLQQIPPPAVPPIFGEILQHTLNSIEEYMPSLSPVFTGEPSSGGESGRAINSRQAASFNQLSNNIVDMNEWRMARMRMRINLTQQFASTPLEPHLWRRGVDFPEVLREEARYIGYALKMPDSSTVPQTLSGKLEVAQFMAAMGLMMDPEELLKFTGFDRGYGWSQDTFVQPMAVGPDGMPVQGPNQDLTTGVEAGIF